MTAIINQFLEANTNEEVNQIVWSHIDIMNENPALYSFARNARRRINRIRKEKMKSFHIFELN
jgi:hypothetical protein